MHCLCQSKAPRGRTKCQSLNHMTKFNLLIKKKEWLRFFLFLHNREVQLLQWLSWCFLPLFVKIVRSNSLHFCMIISTLCLPQEPRPSEELQKRSVKTNTRSDVQLQLNESFSLCCDAPCGLRTLLRLCCGLGSDLTWNRSPFAVLWPAASEAVFWADLSFQTGHCFPLHANLLISFTYCVQHSWKWVLMRPLTLLPGVRHDINTAH